MNKFRVYCKTESQARKVLEKIEERGFTTAHGKNPIDIEPREMEILVNNNIRKILITDPPSSKSSSSRLISLDVSEFKAISAEDYLNNSFTKEDLKTGHIVECRDGTRYMIVKNYMYESEVCLLGLNTWSTLDEYNDDLTMDDVSYLDIMKVYEGIPTYLNFMLGDKIVLKPIWERTENKVKQLSVDEAAELLKEKSPDYSEIKIGS